MTIFCAVRHSTDPKQFHGGLWSGNFYPALRQLGHEVVESQVDLLPASRFMHIADHFTPEELALRAEITQRIIDEVRAAHQKQPIDLFLSYFYNSHFDSSGFAELQALGIPSVNFYCNSIYQFPFVAEIAPKVDYSWHAEKHARDSYLAVGAKPVWIQMAADPEVYRPVHVGSRETVACFVGQRYADRDRWAATLISANVPLALYGPGWLKSNRPAGSAASQTENYLGRSAHAAGSRGAYVEAAVDNWRSNGIFAGTLRTVRQLTYRNESHRLSQLIAPYARPAIPFEQQKDVFSKSEVVLNFSNVWSNGRPGSKLIPHVRLRDFEAPMCKTCYLTGHNDEIGEFYKIGKEIDTYGSPGELVEKASYYLANPGAAEKLRNAGYYRARRDHTWTRRFKQLFNEIGLST